jgi:RNA-directed DNA polymerase
MPPQAIARVETLLQPGHIWGVDADPKGYFDNTPQDRRVAQVAEKISEGRILRLIASYLKRGVMETGKGRTPSEQGTPQGSGVTKP